jgi:beta-lactamase regulating signal transducer with metallopeptidase domain
MTPLAVTAAAIVLKMSAVLALTLAAAWTLRHRSAALRHWVLAIGLMLAALTPVTVAIAPAWTVPAAWISATSPVVTRSALTLSSAPLDIVPTATAAPPAAAWTLNPGSLSLAIWLAGTTIALVGIAAGFVRLRGLARGTTPLLEGDWPVVAREVEAAYGLTRPVALLQSDHPALLVTWGLLRPRVFLPAAARDWPAERIRIVLRHELAHVVRRDWTVQVAAACFGAVCWFNPLAWIAVRRLRQESEYACDDVVLRHGIDGEQYATHLLAIARAVCQPRTGWIPAPAIARHSTLEQRIQAMLNRTHDRQPPTLLTRVAVGAALGVATLAVAGGAIAEAETPSTLLAPYQQARVRSFIHSLADVPGAGSAAARPIAPTAYPAALAQATVAGQAARASVSGMVVDQLGGFLPGANVTLTSEATGGALVGATDRTGRFEFTDLRPGRYALEIGLPGFQNSRTLVALEGGSAQTRTISMSVGSLQETITVTGTRGATATAEAPPPAAPARNLRDAATSLMELRTSLEQATFRAGTIGGTIKAPAKTRHVNPIYPGALQAQGVEGRVELIAVIGIDGKVGEVLQPRAADTADPVHPDLVAAATAAVQQWEFTPTLLNGVPVPVTMRVHTQFSLR